MQSSKMYLFGAMMLIVPLLACNSVMSALPFGLGSSPVTAAELPAYPGAAALQEGESTIADTLAQNEQQDAAMREAMGALGGGGNLEQKAYQLPAEATWEQVKAFYDSELSAAGWESGLGGMAGSLIDVNAMMGAANQGNDLFQTALYSRGNQTLTVVMVTEPTDTSQKQLIFSLSTR